MFESFERRINSIGAKLIHDKFAQGTSAYIVTMAYIEFEPSTDFTAKGDSAAELASICHALAGIKKEWDSKRTDERQEKRVES
jgi:hypothetical protein